MITETREIYKCGHCRKLYQIKSACIKHEIQCSNNPENDRACFGCVFLEKKEVLHYSDDPMCEGWKVNVLHCSKIDSYLYPPKVEIKGNMYNEFNLAGNIENNPMRKDCDDYKSIVDIYFENR